jgi:hypothetical protein
MLSTPQADDPNAELRRHPRADLFAEISCAGDGVVARSQVADLSVGGMFIELIRSPFVPGARLTVRFTPRPLEPPVVAEALVHYVQPLIGIGIRFSGLHETDRSRVAAYVEEHFRQKRLGAPPVRKSARVSVTVPVRMRASPPEGEFDEPTTIVTLSKHGACLVSPHRLDVGTKLRVLTPAGREFKGNVVWVGTAASRSDGQVGIQCRGLAQALGFQFP